MNRYVFGTLLSRETTFTLMMDVWDAAIESKIANLETSIAADEELLMIKTREAEEDDSSISGSATDVASFSASSVENDAPDGSICIEKFVTFFYFKKKPRKF